MEKNEKKLCKVTIEDWEEEYEMTDEDIRADLADIEYHARKDMEGQEE